MNWRLSPRCSVWSPRIFCIFAFILTLQHVSYSQYREEQFKDQKFRVGIRLGGAFSKTEFSGTASGYNARAYFRHSYNERLRGEFGLGIGELKGSGFKSRFVPLDYRLLISLYLFPRWNPYVYVGAGGMYFDVQQESKGVPLPKVFERTGYLPVGVGAQFMVDEIVALDITGGYNKTFKEGLTPTATSAKASFWNLGIGVSVVGEKDDDPDRDGLKTSHERRIGTDPYDPDTDKDGLTDGEEVLKYKTNPLNPDTDGDGLKDGEEVKVYSTDPLNPDTDGDGLKDGDEVLKYKTNPLRVDTDGDGLTDGDEVLKYKTNPLDIDTDKGTVPDGVEVRRGTNPLDPSDDIPKPKKEALVVEVGKAIVLEGVVFKFGSAILLSASEQVLDKAYATMKDNPDIEVEIHGHTDNKGKPSYNLKLSLARANSVKAYLVKKGISAKRIGTRGFAAVRPIATNDTDEGRQRNRRIEFYRVK